MLLLGAQSLFSQDATREARASVVTIPASTQYERTGLWRALFGKTWRDVWAVPFEVRVLDLGTFAGGLEPFRKGGNQSKTLRLHGADGLTYIFRSTDKDIQNALPPDFRGTFAGEIVQDQTSSFHPAGALVAATLQQALGMLTAAPQFVVMPDDPRLGEFRADFKNMLGMIEERPDEGEMSAQYAGAKDIVSTEKLLEELEQSTKSRIDSREYLKARLLDFIIGDTDRGADQWRWARYDRDGARTYRPIARDRDYAFMRTEGFLTSMAAKAYPKLTRYRPEFPQLNSLVFMTAEFDRSHLIELPRSVWDSVVADVQRRLTDQVIETAIARIPEPQRRLSEAELRAGLRGRRETLPVIAHQFYTLVAQDADVYGSDDDEHAEIDRNRDGSVRVRMFRSEHDDVAVFDRTFLPRETQAIYVHLERGNDRAVVRGHVARSIQLRVIGGEGDDVLIDSGLVAHGDETRFYDASGQNTLIAGGHTDISRTPFVTAQPKRSLDEAENAEPEKHPRTIAEERRGRFQDLLNAEMGYVEQKTKAETMRMWGKKSTLAPLFAYRDGPGVIVGIGPTTTEFGFRRRPYEWQTAARVLFGTATGGFGVQLSAERHFEASPWSMSLFGHATQIESNRFFGYGNDTPFGDLDATLIMRDEVLVQPSVNYSLGRNSRVSVGPVLRLTRPHVSANGPADVQQPLGTDKYSQLGARADVQLLNADRRGATQRGLDLQVGGSGYPAALDVARSFGEAH
ncbi:MAG TPA: hypothetical protein VF021_04655, partial [Longimicrobiales bacterium]